jgi:hypothetical protein
VAVFSARATSNFIRVPLSKGASIEVPRNWQVLSESERVTIDTFVEAKGYRQTESTLSFSAKLFDAEGKTMASVEARFYPDNALLQSEVKQLTTAAIKEIDAELRKAVEIPLKSMGVRVTNWYGSKVQMINGLYVYVHEHQISGFANAGPTRLRGMRIWASPRSFTVTLSYRERYATMLLPIVDRMASSIRLD